MFVNISTVIIEMTTTCVVRHQGAIDWIKKQNIHIDTWTDTLDLNSVKSGDIVMGILPIHLAAEVCSKGGSFVALCMDLPKQYRGKELSVEELENLSCTLKPFHVESISVDQCPNS